MTDPWLFNLTWPRIIPTDAREEMMALAFGQTEKAYLRKVWSKRYEGKHARKPRSLTWPPTCRTERGFVLPARNANNVTPIKRERR